MVGTGAGVVPSFDPEVVPSELKALPQWVTWQYRERDGRRTKVPVSPRTGTPVDHLDPENWRGFGEAARFPGSSLVDGVGFVFTAKDPYTGVDLDGVIDPETGEIEGWAQEMIERLDSYTEVSPSGTGLHVVVRGVLPDGGNRKGRIEMYDRGRLFAVTGRALPGRPATVEERGGVLAALHRETFGEDKGDGPDGDGPKPVSPEMSDEEVLEKARRARNGAKFERLWAGDTDDYGGDHSNADLALVSALAFYSQDAEQIDRLFRESGLYREKWEREDYRDRTVRKALVGRNEFYGRGYEGREYDFGEIVFIEDEEGEWGGRTVPGGVPGSVPDTVPTVPTISSGDGPRARGQRGIFPVEVLPPALRRITEEVSREMNVPPEYFVAPALATLAVAIGGTRFLNVSGSWDVRGNVSSATVAESSDKKTPPYKVAIAPAMRLQKEYFREYVLGKEEYEEKYRRWEFDKKNTPKGEFPPPPPEEPKLENVVAHDFTSEALADVLNDTPRGVLITDDELAGFFSGLDQYKAGGRGNERQRHLKIMSNTSFTVRRRGGDPVFVEDPVASYTGNIQPDVLPAMLIPKPGGRKGDADDGMLHRWLFAFPPSVDTVDSLDEGKVVTPAAKLQYDFLYKKLRDLEMDAEGNPRRVEFTPEAFKKFNDEVYKEWQRRKNRPGLPRLLRSSYGKMADHTARIALVLALCRDPDANTGRVVGAEDVEGAAAIAEYFAVQMRKVQAAMRREKEGKEERYLRVLNDLLDKHGDRWRVATSKLRVMMLERGVYDVPERPGDLTNELTALADHTPGLTIESGKRVDDDRAVEITRAAPSAPAVPQPPGRDGRDGIQDTPRDGARDTAENGDTPGEGLDTGGLVLFALGRLGAAYPEDLVRETGRKLKTVKNALTKLQGAGKVEYTGNTNDKKASEVRLVCKRRNHFDPSDTGDGDWA